jgi:hypothetical protein
MGVEQQRLYEVVKMREQFGDVLEAAGGEDEEPEDEDEQQGGSRSKRRRKRKGPLLGTKDDAEEEDKESRKKRKIQREALDRQRRTMGVDKPKMLEVGDQSGQGGELADGGGFAERCMTISFG